MAGQPLFYLALADEAAFARRYGTWRLDVRAALVNLAAARGIEVRPFRGFHDELGDKPWSVGVLPEGERLLPDPPWDGLIHAIHDVISAELALRGLPGRPSLNSYRFPMEDA